MMDHKRENTGFSFFIIQIYCSTTNTTESNHLLSYSTGSIRYDTIQYDTIRYSESLSQPHTTTQPHNHVCFQTIMNEFETSKNKVTLP